MFVLSVLEAPNTKTNSLCVQTDLAINLFQKIYVYYNAQNSISSIIKCSLIYLKKTFIENYYCYFIICILTKPFLEIITS